MLLQADQADQLKEFCAIMLCGHREEVFCRCKACMESPADDSDGVEAILYVLSGSDIDPDDPYGNVADADKQLVQPQSYLISSDAGAPELEDFFWYLENLKAARGLSFSIEKDAFSEDESIVEWLAEFSRQLEDLRIVNFDGGSEDFHFTIMTQADCERAMALFQALTARSSNAPYASYLITADTFQR